MSTQRNQSNGKLGKLSVTSKGDIGKNISCTQKFYLRSDQILKR